MTLVTLAVFWQVNQYDFVNIDDAVYVTGNDHVKQGITLNGFYWIFSTTYAEFWHPLTWFSLMLDYQLYGLSSGAYHMTNLILHILSTLLLFWLFLRMTGAIWHSAFIAALFALHPLHVESVAWIAERKDVLSAFFWMLTLSFYVYYTEKPGIQRYLLVFFSFIMALMSKSMVVTLPAIMILLDYWPLGRFQHQKKNLIAWQFKEKTPFLILSMIFTCLTIYARHKTNGNNFHIPLISRLANAPVSFFTYLEKTFWPYDLAVFYPFPSQIQTWKILGIFLLILFISLSVILMIKRLPYLFVGWSWYTITIMPVIGLIKVGDFAMADRYHYLPSIGIAVMLAWSIPLIFSDEPARKKILWPIAIAFLTILSLLTWKQCGYWKNKFELYNHALSVTKNNYIAYDGWGTCLFDDGNIEEAINNFSKAIMINPFYYNAYKNRGIAYFKIGDYHRAVEDFNKAIQTRPNDTDNALYYYYKGYIYNQLGQYQTSINNYNEAIRLKQDFVDAYNNRGSIYFKLGLYQLAINDYNKAIHLNRHYAEAYNNRAFVFIHQGKKELGCLDAKKACNLGNCRILEGAQVRGLCL
ncbi:MAG: tetratricopeptide repeat protein [Smithella sp.]|nr:tetratricopeptide repeat protein [Smithella sp.]